MKKEKKRALATVADFQRTFTTEHGRRVLRTIVRDCGVFHTSFSPDPYSTAFNEGARDVAIGIMKKLKTDLKDLEKFLDREEDYDKELWE